MRRPRRGRSCRIEAAIFRCVVHAIRLHLFVFALGCFEWPHNGFLDRFRHFNATSSHVICGGAQCRRSASRHNGHFNHFGLFSRSEYISWRQIDFIRWHLFSWWTLRTGFRRSFFLFRLSLHNANTRIVGRHIRNGWTGRNSSTAARPYA